MVVAVLLALLLPMAYVFGRFWVSTGDAAQFISTERHGADYVRPLGQLLDALVQAQSSAVRGQPVDVPQERAKRCRGHVRCSPMSGPLP